MAKRWIKPNWSKKAIILYIYVFYNVYIQPKPKTNTDLMNYLRTDNSDKDQKRDADASKPREVMCSINEYIFQFFYHNIKVI